MIKVTRDTWGKGKGFKKEIYRLRDDSCIQLVEEDGSIFATQSSEFKAEFNDWNCDGDVYELYGAYFDRDGYMDFYTPENIVIFMLEDNMTINYIDK